MVATGTATGAEPVLDVRSLAPVQRITVFVARWPPPSSVRSASAIAAAYPYQSLIYHRSDVDQPILKLWNAYIPVGADEAVTRPIGLLLVRRPTVPGLLALLKPILLRVAQNIFREDKEMMELEQKAYVAQGVDLTKETAPFLLELRRLLQTHALRAEL